MHRQRDCCGGDWHVTLEVVWAWQEPLQSAVQAFAPLDASVSKGIDWLSSKVTPQPASLLCDLPASIVICLQVSWV